MEKTAYSQLSAQNQKTEDLRNVRSQQGWRAQQRTNKQSGKIQRISASSCVKVGSWLTQVKHDAQQKSLQNNQLMIVEEDRESKRSEPKCCLVASYHETVR
jgi:hypothetical protein